MPYKPQLHLPFGFYIRIIVTMKENNDIVIENLPKVIFIIPMRGCPVFPGLYTTIEVSDKQDIEIIRHCERFNGFGLVMLKIIAVGGDVGGVAVAKRFQDRKALKAVMPGPFEKPL